MAQGMTSKQRVRTVMEGGVPDRIPAAFEAVGAVTEKLLAHYGMTSIDQLYDRYAIDIVPAAPRYTGPELKTRTDANGRLVSESYWGYESTRYETTRDKYSMTSYFPLNSVQTAADVDACKFPDPDWFDYSAVAETCGKYPDKAIIIGHEGPFQMVTFLIEMDKFFLLMLDAPEAAQRILDRMVEFELEYYRRCFEAAEGRVDILRVHDDYGTQISLLFSTDMWREFFRGNTGRLVQLAHRYGAFYQQHSCGAVGPIIPELIACGADALEPVQKVAGLEIDTLRRLYHGKIVFHGGVDTQRLLPCGTPEEVGRETRRIMETLGRGGGYILMASQAFETDVPLDNIEAVYSVPRTV